MNKSSIIKAIVVFLAVGIFMYLSKLILGTGNEIMGMLIVLSVLMLLGKDLTGNPYRNISKISILGVGSVVCSYLANINIYLGIIVNLIWIFIIVYSNVFNLKIPMYISFLLTYIMLLTLKTTGGQIIPRSLALIFSGVLIVAIQVLLRKKKLKNTKRPNLLRCLRVLDKELESIVNDKDIRNHKEKFNEAIKIWNSNLLERRQNNFYFTARENRQSIMIANLEKLQKDIIEIKKYNDIDESFSVVLVSLRLVVNEIIRGITGKASINDVKERLSQYQENSKDKINNYHVYSISEIMKTLFNLVESKVYETEDTKIFTKKPTLIKFIKYTFDKDSLRFTFAIRIAILMSISYYAISGMQLEYGKWIMFTLMSVCQPYDTTTTAVGRDRIKGTILGAIIVLVSFTFIQSMALRMGIMGIGFYIFIDSKKPIIKGIGTTMFALSIVELGVKAGQATMYITLDRVMYTIIGFIIAIVGSKIIFQYDIKRETKSLVDKYYKIVNSNIENLMRKDDIKQISVSLRASMILTKSIESKIIINNSIEKSANIELFLEHSRNVMINIYDSLKRIQSLGDKEEVEEVKNKVFEVYKKFGTRFEDTILNRIDEDFEINKRSALYISLAQVLEEFMEVKNIKKEIAL